MKKPLTSDLTWIDVADFFRDWNHKGFNSALYKAWKTPKSDKLKFNRKALFRLWEYEVGRMRPYDTDPPRLLTAVGAWSKSRLPSWQRVWDALTANYDMLYNYDMAESESIDTAQTSNQQTQTAGYDSGDLVQDAAAQMDGDESKTRSLTRKGNIGVTSSQDLLLKEFEIAETDLYRQIVDEFKCEFCNLIY